MHYEVYPVYDYRFFKDRQYVNDRAYNKFANSREIAVKKWHGWYVVAMTDALIATIEALDSLSQTEVCQCQMWFSTPVFLDRHVHKVMIVHDHPGF